VCVVTSDPDNSNKDPEGTKTQQESLLLLIIVFVVMVIIVL